MSRRRGAVGVALLCAAVLALSGAARADVTLQNQSAQPCSDAGKQAGGRADFCISFDLTQTGTDDIKDLVIDLPQGVVGDPSSTSEKCSIASFTATTPSCPADTQVGAVSAELSTSLANMTASGEIYNLQPTSTEPARLGIMLDQQAGALSPVVLQVPIRVLVPNAELRSTTRDLPRQAYVQPLSIIPPATMDITMTHMDMTLWGPAGTSGHPTLVHPFMTMPTRCDVPAVTYLRATAYEGAGDTKSASFTPIGCDKLPFEPGFIATSEVGKDVPFDTPGEASATLTFDDDRDQPIRNAYLKDVALQLPAGLALNPPIANGLMPCTPEQFAQDVDATPQCPANTEMGTVTFSTPLFDAPLTGKVYFGQPRPGVPLVNYISVEDPRLRLKLVGYATIDNATTAITAHFDDQPQVPFTSFKFTYTNNPKGHATLTSPVSCGHYDVTAAMTPWGSDSGPAGPTKSPTDFFNVVADDGTMNCAPEPFTPSISAAVSNPQAGADTALTVHIERPDRQQRLQNMTVSLPPGLTGRLTAVPACPVADARAATCAAASQVGTAKVAVGTGPTPLELPGKVFLTQGFDGGIAGLAVEVDTKLPAIDLGKVVVLNKIVLRPDTGLNVVTEPLPQTLQGIPTVYRSIELTVDKPGFMRNATSCAQQAVHGAFGAVGGAAASADGPYQATGCEKLPFNPKLTSKIGTIGETGVNSHPPLNVTIQQADGEAAMSKTVVTLPAGIGVDIKNLGGLCTGEQLDAGQCPASSRIGDVSADTPLLPMRLSGGVYLLKPDKPGLPGIALDLGLVRLRGSVAINGRLTTTFASVPDVPLRQLVLNLTGGPKGALTTTSNLCTSATPTIDAQYTSQSGVSRTATIPADIVGCTDQAMSQGIRVKGSLTGVKKKRPTVKLQVVAPTALKQVSVKLPSTLKVRSSKALEKAARLLMGGRRQKHASMRYAHGKVYVKAPRGKSSKSFAITLSSKVLKIRGRLKVGSKARFTIAATPKSGRPVSVRLALTARR